MMSKVALLAYALSDLQNLLPNPKPKTITNQKPAGLTATPQDPNPEPPNPNPLHLCNPDLRISSEALYSGGYEQNLRTPKSKALNPQPPYPDPRPYTTKGTL